MKFEDEKGVTPKEILQKISPRVEGGFFHASLRLRNGLRLNVGYWGEYYHAVLLTRDGYVADFFISPSAEEVEDVARRWAKMYGVIS